MLNIKIEFLINYIVQLLQPKMARFGPRGPVIDYDAKVEDIKDNMKSILEKVTRNDRIVQNNCSLRLLREMGLVEILRQRPMRSRLLFI